MRKLSKKQRVRLGERKHTIFFNNAEAKALLNTGF
jgi:hypothetical protein